MSEKNLVDEHVDSEDDDDDDYCPTKTNNEQSDPSDESEHDDDDNGTTVEQTEDSNQKELKIAPYDESKTNELWKNFTSSSSTTADGSKTTTEIPKPQVQSPKPTPPTINKIFDYAGEKVSVPVTTATTNSSSLKRPSTTSNSLLDRLGIGKKQKLSTLEKSRLDWNVHKESESLIEDLDSHRRGKDSYVEKKAFLQRSELREHDHYLTSAKKK